MRTARFLSVVVSINQEGGGLAEQRKLQLLKKGAACFRIVRLKLPIERIKHFLLLLLLLILARFAGTDSAY
ncbi:hypothetical protein Ciccas_012043 [Cichlidogyrus casuarinus]|uniref:Uncharacterized protein n=1 Tax=Cichlidogyrus casuarinus TaxID=1844966 RepID=A0ABD2PUH0_9PLAT